MAKAHRFKHTAAQSKVARKMRGMSPTMAKAYHKAAGKPKTARPKAKSVPVRTVTKTVHHTKSLPRPKKHGGGHFARGFRTGQAVGEAVGDLLSDRREH